MFVRSLWTPTRSVPLDHDIVIGGQDVGLLLSKILSHVIFGVDRSQMEVQVHA